MRFALDVIAAPTGADFQAPAPPTGVGGGRAAWKAARKTKAAKKAKPEKPPAVIAGPVGEPEVTVLSLGGGQDSTELLYEMIFDPEFRAKYAPGKLLVVFSDTMDEHAETYAHLDYLGRLCRENGLELVRLTPEMGYHGKGDWALGLAGFYRASRTVGSKCFRKSCTDNLKIKPIYKYLAARIAREYNLRQEGTFRGKQSLVDFAARYGRLRVLIGFAAGEEGRVSDAAKLPAWMRRSVERVFPLIDQGKDRAACIASMKARGLPVPPPSLCQRCPYKSDLELLWTARKLPDVYADWVKLEAAKIEKFAGLPNNFGVFGKRLLPQVLAEAEAKYAHLSWDQVEEHRMSHGHCVGSAY